MSNMKYDAVLSITPRTKQGDTASEEFKRIPIRAFSVEGGASRSINLSSADEISIASEFEQARTHKNITLFMPPANNFLGVKLAAMRTFGGNMDRFSVFFQVNTFSGGKRTQTLILETYDAWFVSPPTPVGDKEALLMLRVRFHGAQLLHSKLNKASREFVHEEI